MGNRSKLFVAVALVVLLVSSVPLSVMMSDAESPSNEVYCSDFAYSKLTGNDKMAYENLDKGLKKFESTGNCDPITMYADEAAVDLRKLCGVIEAYRSDHPEKFWASYYDQMTTTEDENHYVGVCISDKEKARIAKEPALKDKISELNTKIDNISKSNSKDSLYDRVKYLHDKVINLTKYESDEDKCMDCGNAYGALCKGKSKCDGYSLAFALLCHRDKIQCVVDVGPTNTGKKVEPHAWNAVEMNDKKWYYVDTTWDYYNDNIRYDYFLIGSKTVVEGTTFEKDRNAYWDYGITVSTDKYNYVPSSGNTSDNSMIIIAVIVVIAVIVLAILIWYYFKMKKERGSLAGNAETENGPPMQ